MFSTFLQFCWPPEKSHKCPPFNPSSFMPSILYSFVFKLTFACKLPVLWHNNITVVLARSDKITATGELLEFKIIVTDLLRQADYFNCVDMKHDRHGRKPLCLWGPCFCCWGTPSFLVLQGTRSLWLTPPTTFVANTHAHTCAFWDLLVKYGTFSMAPWASGQFLAFVGFSGGGEQAKPW